ncbi:MAG: methyl-accepting chemotaxis protein, partial [Rhodocyclaceae bacterium]|nr:methyl-accepting chemotaxis protein [Rhodocyclaceae bacterium]
MSSISVPARLGLAVAALLVAAAGLGGVYLAGATPSAATIVFYLLLGLLAVFAPSLILAGRLSRLLEPLRASIAATRRDGDLTRAADSPPASPIAPLATAYNELLSTFHSITTRIIFNADQVARMADKLMREAESTARGSQEQNAAADAAAEAVAEMASRMGEVAGNAAETAQ